jgi:hypothetical protein
MATEEYPNQNVNMPMKQSAVDKARARLDPGRQAPTYERSPSNGKGSRREVRPGEWIDDRVILIGGPSSPSKDSPPDILEGRGTPPATYDPAKAYQIKLGKPIMFAGRMLSPAKTYQMTGDACTEISAAVIDAVELGDVPTDPDIEPSSVHQFKG